MQADASLEMGRPSNRKGSAGVSSFGVEAARTKTESKSHPQTAHVSLDAEAARAKTERLITVRDRSEQELADRLRQAGFPGAIVTAEVARAVTVGLVDDERFTQLYIAGKANKGWGQQRIVREIKRFGIDLEHADGYPEAFFDEADELSRALICVERFRSRAKDPRGACFHKLLSRGFSTEVARRALRTLDMRTVSISQSAES
ncbi:MAG: recombination regulator RecX [Coriobacteriales bacterium]|jgi:regulatory protein|nr:recombination regulator RecX [Coriobacteriales bacterium]